MAAIHSCGQKYDAVIGQEQLPQGPAGCEWVVSSFLAGVAVSSLSMSLE